MRIAGSFATGLAALAGTDRPGLRALMEVSQHRSERARRAGARLSARAADQCRRPARARRCRPRAAADRGPGPSAGRSPPSLTASTASDARSSSRSASRPTRSFGGSASAAPTCSPGERLASGRHRHRRLAGRRALSPTRDPDRARRRDRSRRAPGAAFPGFDLLGALDACGEHLLRYGGHRAAAGLTIAPAEIAAFREAIEAHAEKVLTPDLLAPGRARRCGRHPAATARVSVLPRSCWRSSRAAWATRP